MTTVSARSQHPVGETFTSSPRGYRLRSRSASRGGATSRCRTMTFTSHRVRPCIGYQIRYAHPWHVVRMPEAGCSVSHAVPPRTSGSADERSIQPEIRGSHRDAPCQSVMQGSAQDDLTIRVEFTSRDEAKTSVEASRTALAGDMTSEQF